MSYLIIDIETCALPEAQLRFPEFEANKTLKDPEKIKADLERKKQEFISEAALYAERATVLVVGMMNSNKETTFIEGSEKDVLNKTWELYLECSHHIIGHYIKGFDIPFLMRRSWMNGIIPPHSLMDGRYLNRNIKDTMEAWACGTKDTISLHNLCLALGLNGKMGNGKDFAPKYHQGGSQRQEALEYLASDLLLTHQAANKMGMI